MSITDRLIEVVTFYNNEARRCVKAKSYLAASIMQVAALEGALQAMCFLYPEEMKRTTIYKHKRFRRSRYRALVGGLIVGSPGDTRESIEANLEFARRYVDWPYIRTERPTRAHP